MTRATTRSKTMDNRLSTLEITTDSRISKLEATMDAFMRAFDQKLSQLDTKFDQRFDQFRRDVLARSASTFPDVSGDGNHEPDPHSVSPSQRPPLMKMEFPRFCDGEHYFDYFSDRKISWPSTIDAALSDGPQFQACKLGLDRKFSWDLKPHSLWPEVLDPCDSTDDAEISDGPQLFVRGDSLLPHSDIDDIPGGLLVSEGAFMPPKTPQPLNDVMDQKDQWGKEVAGILVQSFISVYGDSFKIEALGVFAPFVAHVSRGLHALYPFVEMQHSGALCHGNAILGFDLSYYMGIRDKGGGFEVLQKELHHQGFIKNCLVVNNFIDLALVKGLSWPIAHIHQLQCSFLVMFLWNFTNMAMFLLAREKGYQGTTTFLKNSFHSVLVARVLWFCCSWILYSSCTWMLHSICIRHFLVPFKLLLGPLTWLKFLGLTRLHHCFISHLLTSHLPAAWGRLVKKGNAAGTQVLVLWQHHTKEEATWEDYDDLFARFPDFHP